MTPSTWHSAHRLLPVAAAASATAPAMRASSGGGNNAAQEPGSDGRVDPDEQTALA